MAVALAVAAPAGALVGPGAGTIDQAVEGLRSSPVYVDPASEDVLNPADAQRLADEIDAKNAGPMYVVVLPASAAQAAGGDPVSVLREIQSQLGRPGVYAGIIGNRFRAGATGGILPKGETGKLATQAFAAHHDEGASAVLSDFVARVGKARSGGGSGGSDNDHSNGPSALLILGLLGLAGGGYALVRRRKKRRELADVKHVARDDLIALGEEIRALDVDASLPDANADGKQHYNHAVEIYQSAEQGLTRARRSEDLRPISAELEEGRYEMQAAQALFEGKEPPVRRAPCFFDPRHGPSVRMVDWAPPGGTPRPVPACAADAQRIEDGLDPQIRELEYGGRQIPYYAAPAPYTPFFGGFWGGYGGGGFFPGLVIGETLGGGFGGGGGWSDGGQGGSDDQGDFGDDSGGGDFGGDSGGGDFGGGDFGGGGGDF